MRFVPVLVILSFIKINSFAQTTTEWFPADLNIQPFVAHFLEPQTGFQYLFELEKVRIDIGTSHDIVQWKNVDESFSFGADFFTYTRARSEADFKFPVETIDYLFGVNGSYKHKSETKEWGARLRFSHISAHLVDGYYDSETQTWLDNRQPFVYSREFFELIGYYKIYGVRFYGVLTYNIHIVPTDIKNGSYGAGFDYYAVQLNITAFTPFIGYDFELTGIEKYSGKNI
ncbi:MAG: DUF1207 domain-containing protein, partial [Ignavibacteria bacterium]|nr:DUF1207 domain-containing protein [Ignavibacteria bacterium]